MSPKASPTSQPSAQPEPIVAVYASGQVRLGTGVSIGDILQAIETARQTVMRVVLSPAVPQQAQQASDPDESTA